MTARRQSRSVSPDATAVRGSSGRSSIDERLPLDGIHHQLRALEGPDIELGPIRRRTTLDSPHEAESHHNDSFERSRQVSSLDGDSPQITNITQVPKTPSPAGRHRQPEDRPARLPVKRVSKAFANVQSWFKDWWFSELLIFLVSVALFLAIVGILAHYEGSQYPSWPAGITLNAIVSVLVTVAAFLIAMIVGSCMGQLKWNHARDSTRTNDLWAFCATHDAGGQPTAALKLFISWNGLLPLLGALLVVLNQALGPFVQQLIQQENTDIVLFENATLPILRSLTKFAGPGSNAPEDIGIQMRSAIYQGLYTTETRPYNVIPACDSGNCTWPLYTTIAVCSACDDLSGQITRETTQTGDIWRLPSGLSLDITAREYLNAQTQYPAYPQILNVTMIGRDVAPSSLVGDPTPDASKVRAAQCSMRVCTKQMKGWSVNGTFYEVTQSYNETWNYELNQTSPNGTFNNAGDASTTLSMWFQSNFNFSYVTIDTYGGLQAPPPSTSGSSSTTAAPDFAAVMQSALSPSDQKSSDFNMSSLMENVAKSMTLAFRSPNVTRGIPPEPITGNQTIGVIIVSIQWGWIALPVVLYVGIAVLLVATIVQTRMLRADVWKDSSIAMLMHGLSDELRAEASTVASGSEMSRVAKQMRVRLTSTGQGWELGPTGAGAVREI